MLSQVSIGWRWLERNLNRIISAVNQQKPLGSSTIAIEESPNGTVLKVVSLSSSQPGSSGGGGTNPTTGQWSQITVVDVNCNTYTLKVWADNSGAQPVL